MRAEQDLPWKAVGQWRGRVVRRVMRLDSPREQGVAWLERERAALVGLACCGGWRRADKALTVIRLCMR